MVLAHAADGLVGDGVPGALLYGIVVVGALVGALGLRARGVAPVGGPAVEPLTVDGSEGDVWPGDLMPPAGRIVGQAVGLVVLVALLVVGWGGSTLTGLSPVPSTLLLAWWTLPVLALLLGDVYRLVDPFDAVAALVERARPRPEVDPDTEASDWWVPGALLLTFAWMVTSWLDGQQPRALTIWLTLLTAVMVVGAVLGGRAWVRRSSPLAVLTSTVAAAAPLDWSTGRPRFRSPLRGLAARAGGRRSTGVVLVLLGTAFWESVSGTTWWARLIGTSGTGAGAGSLIWSTIGLAWCVLLAGAAWVGVGALAERLAERRGAEPLEEPFGPDAVAALAPLAATALLAHQLGNVVLRSQYVAYFWSDPFAEGWDLFGARDWTLQESWLAPGALAWTQFGFVVVGLTALILGTWDRLASRVGRAVVDAGWALAGATAGLGSLALWLLLGA